VCVAVSMNVRSIVIRNSSTRSSNVPALTISAPSLVFSLPSSSIKSRAIAVALTDKQTPIMMLVPLSRLK